MFEEPVHFPVLEGQVPRIDDPLQEKVGLLQLVIEKEVVLGEGEGPEVVFGDHPGTQDVEARKQPAAAGGLLVRAALGLYLIGEMGIDGKRFAAEGEGRDGRAVQRVAEGFFGGRAGVALADLGQDFRAESAAGLGGEGEGAGEDSGGKEDPFHIVCVLCRKEGRRAMR